MSKKISKGKQDETESLKRKGPLINSHDDLSKNPQEVSILNENNDTEIINFAPDEMLENVQIGDSTVEVVGFLDEIEGPKIVGKAQHYRLLKFILNNNSRHRVQVVAWNSEVERIQHHLQPNRIIHVDGAKAKIPKVSDFNNGTLPYELIILSNTTVNNLGVFNLKTKIDAIQPQEVQIPNIPEYVNSCVLINGFVKTTFNTISSNFKTYGYGSVTDGTYKLEVQIINYEFENLYQKGQQLQIKGYIKTANDIFYLEVESMSNIKLKDSKTITFAECLRGSKPITKRPSLDNSTKPLNKIARI